MRLAEQVHRDAVNVLIAGRLDLCDPVPLLDGRLSGQLDADLCGSEVGDAVEVVVFVRDLAADRAKLRAMPALRCLGTCGHLPQACLLDAHERVAVGRA